MSYLWHQDLQNSRERRSWLRNNWSGVILGCAIAIGVDQLDNTTNKRIIAPTTGTPVNATPFST